MPVLFRDTVTRQPQYPAGINWGNQLTNGLTGAYGADRRNVVTGIPATSVTAATGANRFGRSLVFAGGTEVAQYDATLQPTVPFTALTVMVPNFSSASTTRQGIWHFQASAGSIQNRLRLIWLDATNGFYIDTNGGFAYRCTPTFSAGDPLILAYTRAGVSASNQFYVNGLAQSTTLVLDSSATAGMPTAVPLWLGDDVEASGRRLNGAINLHLHFSRTLAASEVKSLSDNPWQIYRPPARKLWLMGAAGGTHTTSGTVAGAGATVAGTATHKTLHTTLGAVAGAGATVAGAATHPHTTSGAVTGAGATIAGASDHTTPGGTHTTTGDVAGSGATVAGAATHKTLHATSGVVQGAGATVTGDSAHLTLHTTTGDVAGGGATVAGAASRSGINEARSGVVREWLIQFYEQEWAKPIQAAKAPEPPKKVGALKPAVRAVRNALEPVAEVAKVQKVAPRVAAARKSSARTAQPAVTTIVQSVLLQAQKAALQDREFVNALNTRQQQQRAAEADEAEDEELLLLAVL